ncbi:hypothetical protein EDD18DRAFT_1329355 [Armillaria luteobubalina]|uniref:Cytochrome P450 n=1 Tax=Armillaria luteobubalina TaxID=153913 RepID=A0AA39V072_9AGAR|nr:hypothetical protein EDD18DRAFT_1329355 [Armillaria luteobubalina]
MGVAHRSVKADVYRGYYIPVGATVVLNTWAMLHDENDYPNPLVFDPERFMPENRKEIAIMSMASTLSFSKAIDSEDHVIEPSAIYMDGSVSFPEPFKCIINARFLIPLGSSVFRLTLLRFFMESSLARDWMKKCHYKSSLFRPWMLTFAPAAGPYYPHQENPICYILPTQVYIAYVAVVVAVVAGAQWTVGLLVTSGVSYHRCPGPECM